jgi:cytochrome P450
LIGHTWSLLRRPFAFLESLRSQGKIVRVDVGKMPVYMLTRPELVHTILIGQARRAQRTGILFDRMREVVGNGLAASDGELHLLQRRLMQPVLHRNRIDDYVGLMLEHTQALSDSWRDGQIVDVDHAMADLIAVNAGSLFGLSLDRELSETVRRAMPILTDNFMVRLLTPVLLERFLPLPANRRFNQALRELRGVIDQIITQHRGNSVVGDDLLSALLAATDPDTSRPISLDQVYDEVISVMLAGIVTTAPTVAWLFYELMGLHRPVGRCGRVVSSAAGG